MAEKSKVLEPKNWKIPYNNCTRVPTGTKENRPTSVLQYLCAPAHTLALGFFSSYYVDIINLTPSAAANRLN